MFPTRGLDSGLTDAGDSPSMFDGAIDDGRDTGVIDLQDGAIRDASDLLDARIDNQSSQARIRVGFVLADDSSVWCITRASGEKDGELEAWLRRVPSDAEAMLEDPHVSTTARVVASLSCSASADGGGEHKVITSDASRDADGDRVLLRCPDALAFGRDPQCRIEAHDEAGPDAIPELRHVSMPSHERDDGVPYASSERCIGGVADWVARGQVTGFVSEYMTADGTVVGTLPLQNEALMRSTQVGGTDEGAIFLAQGKLWFVFGDTSALDANDPLTVALQGPGLWRSNVLAYSSDFDATDGFHFEGFETVGDSMMAAERVLSPHDMTPGEGAEVTAIPIAGFGLTSVSGTRYRFLWFVSINTWSPNLVGPEFVANYATLAYAVDDEPSWTRMPSPPAAPSPQFGPGTVWFDRYHRYLYFFGVTPDRGAIRLARVPSTFEKIADPAEYEYWDGASWIAGDATAAAALIDTAENYAPRSEISIAWNPAAEVWMMMLVNWYSAATPSNQVELWQAPAVTGPWKKVDADAQLPNGAHVLQYGPMISEHLLGDGGLHVPCLLSQLFPVYNVHHHSYRVVVAEGADAEACPR